MPTWDNPLVTIIGEKCRMCYACVRECPAKAIQVVDGQASVIQPRCIGCGNCLRVCSQNAKHVRDDTERAFALLESESRVAATVAPSFPAEFADIEPGILVAMIRALGFDSVHEVSLGADLVAEEYRRLLEEDSDSRYITTPCPAVVSYVRKYHPRLLPYLAPVVSPMVAMARVLRQDLGDDLKVVFIGPCIAKKRSSIDATHSEIDAALTFAELRDMFQKRGITPEAIGSGSALQVVSLGDASCRHGSGTGSNGGHDGDNGVGGHAGRGSVDRFDPPYGGVGAVFPISGGLLQTAEIKEDLTSGEVVVAEGRGEFIETISEFDLAHADTRLLDVLSCQGCYAGAGMTSKETMLQRRTRVSNYAKSRLGALERDHPGETARALERYGSLDLSRSYYADRQTLGDSATPGELEEILHRMGKFSEADLLNCGACGYDTCLDHARAFYAGLAGSEMCLPYTIEQLRTAYEELEDSHRSLESAKEALERSGRLASMGQLAAGIAHEVNNPLGTLLLHANLLLEDCQEQSPVREDLETIVDQANRCKRIISGLLNFARQSRVVREPTDVADLLDKVLRTTPTEENIEVRVQNRLADPVAEIDSDQIVQVITNLLSNARQAMPDGGTIVVSLSDEPDEMTIKVSDTGEGIPEQNVSRLFDPFFTTKQVGVGTGLGLAVTHGIVKMHRGHIEVESNADPEAGPTGATFIVTLPRYEERVMKGSGPGHAPGHGPGRGRK